MDWIDNMCILFSNGNLLLFMMFWRLYIGYIDRYMDGIVLEEKEKAANKERERGISEFHQRIVFSNVNVDFTVVVAYP